MCKTKVEADVSIFERPKQQRGNSTQLDCTLLKTQACLRVPEPERHSNMHGLRVRETEEGEGSERESGIIFQIQ